MLAGCGSSVVFHDPPVARRIERPRFLFDAGTVWRGDVPWIQIEVSIPYPELMFRADGDSLRASFDLIAVLYHNGTQLTGDLWRQDIAVGSMREARSTSGIFRRSVLLPGHPGDLRVEVTVSEQSSGNEGRISQDIRVREPGSEDLSIGKIWFERCGTDSAGNRHAGGGAPIVGRRFGSDTGPVCVWTVVRSRGIKEGSPLTLEWKILGQRREPVVQDRSTVTAVGDSIPISFRLPLQSLWLGGYDLWLQISAGDVSASRDISFDMDETMVTLEQNPSESIALVRLIATSEEIDALESAPPEARERAWVDFWEHRDPTPGTEQNEFKEEFFARVRYANEHFSSLGPGWKTDRGMIYIQYGPPDQVESYPHNVDGPPYEVWWYYQLRRRYVFVDYDGFGRYEIYTPGRLR
jgi:GWxTD domain-containing protein